MSDFLAMGGYAFYVWTAYALALGVLVVNLVSPFIYRRRLLAEIARKARRAQREVFL
ncbi:MAG: heme exporter protein CcmD [Pseudomonadota bacterium]